MTHRTRNLLFFVAVGTLALTGCGKSEPDRWAPAQEQSSESGRAVSSEAVEGGQFNRFFPPVEKPWDIVFKQEKSGFAQASLQQDGREVAVLSVSDTTNNPDAAEKFKASEKQLAGYPMVAIGEQTTAILVGERYQVQIRSADPVFGPQEREQWLPKFNLEAISRIR
jgi:hypothetical protein